MEKPNNSIKILVVGEAASIHTAKYVSMLKKTGYDVRLFSNAQNSHQDGLLKNTIIYQSGPFSNQPARGNILYVPFLGSTLRINDKSSYLYFIALKIYRRGAKLGAAHKYLNKVIKRWNPALVISLKMQDDGYVTSNTKSINPDAFPPWAHFIWGTDIEFFGKHPDYIEEHLPKIKKLLAHCDYLIADTHRDLEAANALGFKGISLGKQIAQGGFDMDYISRKNTRPRSERNVIIIKGRNGGLVGRAMNTLEALRRMKERLTGFEIKIIMPTMDVRECAAEYSKEDKIHYECMGRLDYAELMDLFGRARIAISATDVDGTPGFLLEAMCMGALPVHSDMASIREWIVHEQNGLLFPVDDIEAQKSMILRALSDDALFDGAREKNKALAHEKMDEKIIAQQTEEMIRTILSGYPKKEESRKAA